VLLALIRPHTEIRFGAKLSICVSNKHPSYANVSGQTGPHFEKNSAKGKVSSEHHRTPFLFCDLFVCFGADN
jgi:hypothetical protein